MTRQYSFDDKNLIEQTLCELFPPEWLRDKAKETGLIKRERKIDPVIMFWTLAIGYGRFLQRTLAGIWAACMLMCRNCCGNRQLCPFSPFFRLFY